ncbi:MAG: hypothetical protein M1816_005339 [Peltula sp. TS41687]|nr:MAG: hypothetical protein M1816_005339 [Peltula sp. TS41687]
MEVMDSTTIADLSFQCKQKFMSLKREISMRSGSNSQDGDRFPEGFISEDNLDSFARFRVWIGNIGALQRNKSSLDYRIRHSEVRDEVVRLLTQLLSALTDLKSLVAREREQQTWYTSDLISSDDTENDSNASESEFELDTSDGDPVLMTESSQLGLIISDVIGSLFKLSIIIQKSSRQAKFVKSSREKPYDTRFDVLHVQECFPFAASNSSLVEKLGKANAQRRQWLSYRRRHRDKLSFSTGSMDRFTSDSQSQLSSDLYSQNDSSSSCGPQSSVTADSSTVATTFHEAQLPHYDPNVEEEASETSYSTSAVSGLGGESIFIPRLPSESAERKPFECPFCFMVISLESLRSWM